MIQAHKQSVKVFSGSKKTELWNDYLVQRINELAKSEEAKYNI